MKKFIAKILGSTALAFVALVVPFVAAQAATISPPYFDYSINPGDTILDVIKIYNENTQNPLTIYPVVQNFTYKEGTEEGTPAFYPAAEDPTGTALAKWITVDTKPIVVGPGQRANLPFSLSVPQNAQPGGHFGAILLSTTPPAAEGGTVGITSQIASLILVRVSGDVKDLARVAEFGFKEQKLWYNYLPVDFFVRFENDGNTHLRPAGNLFIKNWYGRQVAAIKVNEGFGSVLPKSIRRFEFGWKNVPNPPGKGDLMTELKKEWNNFALGKYTATLVLNYGASNQLLSEERVFYVWPWRLLTILGAAVIIVLLLVTLLMRAYNKAVIRKYELEKTKKK